MTAFRIRTLAKDLSIIAVDPAFGVGNGKVFPAGPLRERLADGLARADALVFLQSAGDKELEESDKPPWFAAFTKPILRAKLEPVGALPEGPLIAFAGIGAAGEILRHR